MQSLSDVSLNELVQQVAAHLLKANLKLVTAESCTGGWVAKCCTDLPGSSQWFERGYVTYSNEAKMSELGIEANIIEQHGAVSRETVEAMALGALTHSKANISVAITGIAGPDGGSEYKPVGTVWLAWASQENSIKSSCHLFAGDRENIRRQAVQTALQGIIKNARD